MLEINLLNLCKPHVANNCKSTETSYCDRTNESETFPSDNILGKCSHLEYLFLFSLEFASSTVNQNLQGLHTGLWSTWDKVWIK